MLVNDNKDNRGAHGDSSFMLGRLRPSSENPHGFSRGECQIPEYTAEDYYSSSAPFEWLYAYKDDKFLLQQLVQKMKAKAGAVGVRSFMALWNAYCEMVRKQAGTITENATAFDGQEVELLSGEYRCDDSGVWMPDKFGYEICVCCHPILPIRRLINADTQEERLEIAYKKGKSWRSIIVEKSVIASANQILQLAAVGVVVTSENAKALSTYLLFLEQKNYEVITEQYSVSRVGWIGNHGFAPYIDNLVFDGESNFKHIFNAICSQGDREKWIEAMKKIRAEKTVARIALAASFASAMLEPCGLLPFFLHLWGGSGTGKTVALMIAASVWGSPKMGDYIMTFNSTDVGQEMTAAFLNSLPMCIDELQIQASAGVRDFDRMIYKLAEGIGKTRGAKTGGLRQTATWKNAMITTGEFPIIGSTSMSGASVRVIECECADKIYSDLVGLCATINANYGFAGKEFIEHLHDPGVAESLNDIQKGFFRELLKYDSTDKQAASASAILTADFLATQWIFQDDNALTVNDIAEIMTKKDDSDANLRAYEYVKEIVGRNPNKFKPNDFGDYQNEAWGKIDTECIYIIKSVFDREINSAGFNSTAFLSWAKRRGLLRCDKDGRRTRKTQIAGQLVNSVCLLKDPDSVLTAFNELQDAVGELPY